MGVDVCYTNHAEADQDDMDTLLTLLGAAGVNYIMGVPGADDIMLGYQSTSFHDAHYLRQLLGRRPAPEFEAWLEHMQFRVPTTDCVRTPSAIRCWPPDRSTQKTRRSRSHELRFAQLLRALRVSNR
jgi:hypothetical protein